MLLNEFLKEHKKVEEQESRLTDQTKEIAELKAALKNMSARLDANADFRLGSFLSAIASAGFGANLLHCDARVDQFGVTTRAELVRGEGPCNPRTPVTR